MVVKYERGIAKLVHDYDGLAWVHCHGSIGAVLDHFVSTGMDGLHPIDTPPIGDTPLGEAKRKMDGKMCIIGRIQIGDIYSDHKRVMEKKVREAIETCGPDGFILYTSATLYTPIPDDTMGNYESIVKTARAFGAVSY